VRRGNGNPVCVPSYYRALELAFDLVFELEASEFSSGELLDSKIQARVSEAVLVAAAGGLAG